MTRKSSWNFGKLLLLGGAILMAAVALLFVPLAECTHCTVTRDVQELLDEESAKRREPLPPRLVCRRCRGTHRSSLARNWLNSHRRCYEDVFSSGD